MTREDIRQILGSEDEQEDIITLLLNRFQAEKSQVKQDTAAQERARELEEELRDSTEKIKNLKKQLTETRGTLKTTQQENLDNENLLTQLQEKDALIEQLQNENKETKISSAINTELTTAGVKNQKFAKLILKSIDMDKIEIDKDGVVTGIEEQISALKEDEDTAMLFKEVPKNNIQSYNPLSGNTRDKSALEEMFERERAEKKNVTPENDPFLQALK